jgi:hypothetical protein
MRHVALLRVAVLATLFAVPASSLASVPFWGERSSAPIGTKPADLKDGQWVWQPAAAPEGPIVVVVSLDEQMTYAYRNGLLIGYATSSSGKPGHGTPTGVFQTLQKDATHRSSTYNNAPMPFQQRLTWDGVALHAGGLPGYPSSHGCVHLPSAFAQALFEASPLGMTVVVATEATAPKAVAHPMPIATVDPATGVARVLPRLQEGERFRLSEAAMAEGPLALVLSRADARIIVMRNGQEVARSRVDIEGDAPFGTHVYIAKPGVGQFPRWVAVSVPGAEADSGVELDPAQVGRVRFPRDFLEAITTLITPGTTLLVTDEPIVPDTTGVEITVLTSHPDSEAAPVAN